MGWSADATRCKWGDKPDCTAKCNGGDAGSCETLCMMVYHGKERLLRQYQNLVYCTRACNRNYSKACLYNGMVYRYGEGMFRDPLGAITLIAHSINLYNQQCDGGKVLSCIELAKLYKRGHSSPEDFRHAARYYTKACFKGHADSCDEAALLHKREPEYRGKQKNPAKAVNLWVKGCSLGCIRCCAKAARAYDQGLGVLRKPSLAAEFFGRACDSGDTLSCNRLGHLYIDGAGIFQNIERGLNLLRKACEETDKADKLHNRYCLDWKNAKKRHD
jgi:TPR repeat protein